MNRIVLLSDDDTSVLGRVFFEKMSEILARNGLEVYKIHISVNENILDAISQFDRISLEIKPDLMFVADFACIRMQSTEEVPMYNLFSFPIVHLLFRRPWEYEIFMNYRCSFITRFYCVLQEDAAYIKKYHDKLLNVDSLDNKLWGTNQKGVCYYGRERSVLKAIYEQAPAYVKTLGMQWKNVMKQNPGISDVEGLRICLHKIGFAYQEAELPGILYMLRDVFPLEYLESQKIETCCLPEIDSKAMEQQVNIFLDMNFKVSLL